MISDIKIFQSQKYIFCRTTTLTFNKVHFAGNTHANLFSSLDAKLFLVMEYFYTDELVLLLKELNS